MQKSLSTKWIISLAVSALPVFTLLFFSPSFMYFRNIQEFSFGYGDILPLLLVVALLVTLALAYLLTRLGEPYRHLALTTTFALGILLWIQANLLVWRYGLWDGKQIDWSAYTRFGIIDTSVWLLLLALLVWRADWFKPRLMGWCGFFLLIQAGALLYTGYVTPQSNTWKQMQVDISGINNFSARQNVVLIVLDTFQSDIFNEIRTENEDLAAGLEGFTYYPDATGAYTTTLGSIPLLLTGQKYDNSVPYQTYLQSAYMQDSLPKILKENGFISELYPDAPATVLPSPAIADNIVARTETVKISAYTTLYQLSLFRCLPHFCKRFLYDTDYQKAASVNAVGYPQFYRQIPAITAETDRPMFKFIHFRGLHPPFMYNENLEEAQLPQDRNGAKAQAQANMKMVVSLVDKMKQLGIYEQSMIVIVADHGMTDTSCGFKNAFHPSAPEVPPVVNNGVPLVLVKPFAAQGDLRLSMTPVSLADVIPTITSQLGISRGSGRSILAIGEEEKRTRYFYSYSLLSDDRDIAYLPAIEEYRVEGFSWDLASWSYGGLKYLPPGSPGYKFQLGDTVEFDGSDRDAQWIQVWGWGPPEQARYTWTVGRNVGLGFPVSGSGQDLVLTVACEPFLVPGKLDEQRVKVRAGGQLLGEWHLNSAGRQEVSQIIPAAAISESCLEIELEFLDAASPQRLGFNADDRVLGIMVSSVKLAPIAPARPGGR